MSKCRRARRKSPSAHRSPRPAARAAGFSVLPSCCSPRTQPRHAPRGSPVVSASTPTPGPAHTTSPLGARGCRASHFPPELVSSFLNTGAPSNNHPPRPPLHILISHHREKKIYLPVIPFGKSKSRPKSSRIRVMIMSVI